MRLAVIGDIHGFWDARDTEFFNASAYDALLFVGDLPRVTGGLELARELARLNKPAWLIPGNHDGCSVAQFLAEIRGWRTLRWLTALGMRHRVARLDEALGPVRMAGFEGFELDDDLGLIVARPHAMGPDRFYFGHYLAHAFDVHDYEDSADRLKALVDDTPGRLIFLAHNGPAGLGDSPRDIWGCDFAPENGDFGDSDLRTAIEHAKAGGREVLAVLAGHMHLRSKKGDRRRSATRASDTLYINAAEVARIRAGGTRRHHVALRVDTSGAEAETVWVDADGNIVQRQPLPDHPDG